MTKTSSEESKIKLCCASFCQREVVRVLLGDVFHPGGLDLTYHLGQVIGLRDGDCVLDVACGCGTSAVHLTEHFGCHVTGLDYSAENISTAEAVASQRTLAHQTTFRQGDAEELPFGDGAFDAIVSECSFCTFPDKTSAAVEMARVLRTDGRLGLTDITVKGALPNDIQSLLAWVACVAGADQPEGYVATLRSAGFTDFIVQDHRDALLALVADLRRKLLGVELAARLGKVDLGALELDEGKRLARRAVGLIESGVVGYTLIAARKG